MKHLSIFSCIFCCYLIISCWLPAAVHAQTSGTNIDCPDVVYKGNVEFTFIKEDVGPIKDLVDNMFFFYGIKPENPPEGNDALHLKSIMICSDGDKEVNTAISHTGIYTFLNKKCVVKLNGNGRLRNSTLIERGKAKLSCKDKSIYKGHYSITATNILNVENNQGNGSDPKGSRTKNNGSSPSGNTWNGLITEPKQENGGGQKLFHPKKPL